jgi:protein TonB
MKKKLQVSILVLIVLLTACSANRPYPPELIHRTQPKYPKEARSMNIQGNVILDVEIMSNGEISKIEVKSCYPVGYGFEEAAINAVKRWKFLPSKYNGEPVACWVQIPITFK